MNQPLLPLPLQTFTNKLKTFTIFNIIYLCWIIAQLIIFAVTTAQVPCTESIYHIIKCILFICSLLLAM